MPSPPLGAGFVEILLVHGVARLHLLPQIPTDALKFFVRHGLPVALRAARFVRPLNRRLASGRKEVNGAAVAHRSIVAERSTGTPVERTLTVAASSSAMSDYEN
jgi:hypothetical protein